MNAHALCGLVRLRGRTAGTEIDMMVKNDNEGGMDREGGDEEKQTSTSLLLCGAFL